MAHTSPDKLRVGIIGFGRRGILHAALVNMNPAAEIAAVYDPDEILLNHMEQLGLGACFYHDLNQMYEKANLDAVFICSPTNTHLPHIQRAVENNLHIFVERPLAESLVSAEKIMKLVANTNLIFSVGQTFPFRAVFKAAKQLLENQVFEDIKRVRASLYHTLLTRQRTGWMFRKETSGGGVVINAASSLLSLLLWYFGPVKTVFAKTTQKFGEVEDSASIILEFASDSLGYVDASWSRAGFPLPATRVTVEDTQGLMDVSDDVLKIHMYRRTKGFEKGWTLQHSTDFPSSTEFYLGGEGDSEANSAFIDSCLKAERPSTFWMDRIEVMKLIEAVYLSSRSNRVIRLDEV
ncbi:MAG: Gfo/Idh/MocA family oxidoreductase [Candidatus Aminicenantes bacterium]|jgi:predicted dehydrogenase